MNVPEPKILPFQENYFQMVPHKACLPIWIWKFAWLSKIGEFLPVCIDFSAQATDSKSPSSQSNLRKFLDFYEKLGTFTSLLNDTVVTLVAWTQGWKSNDYIGRNGSFY